MTPKKKYFLTILIGVVFYSCDPCNNLDCVTDNYYGLFKIIKATDGTDLIFGPAKTYNPKTIKFYSLKATDTTFFESQAIRNPGMFNDSVLQVHFFPRADTAFMQLSNGDIDTLNILYKTYPTKCCGLITEITGFRINNSVNLSHNQEIYEIRK